MTPVDELLVSLKIIAMVGDGQKLSLRQGRLALGSGNALVRWLTGEARHSTISALRVVISDAIGALGGDAAKADAWLVGRLVADLDAARAGIARLQTTYAGDSLVVAQLQVLVERVDQATSRRAEGEPRRAEGAGSSKKC
jgi:hypothetical protein